VKILFRIGEADFEPQARRYNPECSRPRLQQRAAG
jgi:hypothetical protein